MNSYRVIVKVEANIVGEQNTSLKLEIVTASSKPIAKMIVSAAYSGYYENYRILKVDPLVEDF